jgi:fibronectin type 3 domain-containing protein
MLPVTPTDTFPPAMPADLTAVAENGIVTLLWHPSLDADLAGYRIYRRMDGSPGRILLQEQLVLNLSFRDDQVISGKFYEYQVVAVDTHGNESQAATRTVEVK